MITQERPVSKTEPSVQSQDGLFQPRPHHWTREEYYVLAGAPQFEGRRIERIGGELIDMAPMNSSHMSSSELVVRALAAAFGPEYWIRNQGPLEIGADSDPEPDAAVVSGGPRDYPAGHPGSALLVVEVSETTLGYDRGAKASLYASAGISEYWIVNLNARKLEVYRNPEADVSQPFGYRYASAFSLGPDESIAPLAAPENPVSVAGLLP